MDTNPVIDENQITVETPDWPNQSGGRGDIFIGHHATAGKVALKRLRLPPHVNDTEATRRLLENEGRIWRRLSFSYLHPFLGIYYKDNWIYVVTPFEENGSLPKYLVKHTDADRRLLLYQVSLAIAYLHNDCGIIHGNIKGENILISRHHTALLSDYGPARSPESMSAAIPASDNAIPWQSPEVLNGASKTSESDMYAFGMTISEGGLDSVYTVLH